MTGPDHAAPEAAPQEATLLNAAGAAEKSVVKHEVSSDLRRLRPVMNVVTMVVAGSAVLALSVAAGRALRPMAPRRGGESGAAVSIGRRGDGQPGAAAPRPRSAVPESDAGSGIARAELLYVQHCARCHGVEGRGDGEAGATQGRPPRDFRAPQWRFPKTAASIERVIAEGLPMTTMPSFDRAIGPADRVRLAELVLRLAVNPVETSREPDLRAVRLAEAGLAPLRAHPAHGLQLEAPDGTIEQIDFGDGRPYLIHFWGIHCPHCLQELPAVAACQKSLMAAGSPLRIISLCADDGDAAEVGRLAAAIAPGHAVWIDAAGLAAQQFGAQALPYVVLIDSAGRTAADRIGAGRWDAAAFVQAAAAIASASAR